MKTTVSKKTLKTPTWPSGILSVAGAGFIAVWFVCSPVLVPAQTAIDEDSPWPRVRSTNGITVTLNLPQVERWTSNSFEARAVVSVKPAAAKTESLGVIWFEAHGNVDRADRVVMLDKMEITKGRFPDSTDNGSNALALVKQLFPGGPRTVSLDYLITALGFVQAAARQGAQGLKHTPPEIIWVTNRTALVLVDGEPVFRPVTDSRLERVINTPALLVREKSDQEFYLSSASGQWFSANSLNGPWSMVQSPPPEVAALTSPPTNSPPASEDVSPSCVIVRTKPAELVMTDRLPDFKPIRGTALQYAADSDSQLFFDTKERAAYLLLSGRWFKASSLNGPWTYVAPHDLPDDFRKIPPGSPQAMVLASVPDTPQSELALIANSAPTTATVNRRTAKIELKYDGEPKFQPIEGTKMSYAVNAQLPVIQLGTSYYAVDDAVWFVASSATGPWEVATEVPEDIYTIPPSSPVYYATFVRIYDYDDENVEVGYTAGYTGSYEDDGTTVYGTDYDYEPYYGEDCYYGWGWTWGYSYWYVPWYGWWVWNPWWNDRGGLRAAIIDNIYDRWQTPGVTPHDRVAGARSDNLRQAFTGYPALYGRFQGSTRAAALAPPAITLALNPYSRPQAPVRAGETPRGAQLLSNVRRAPGGGLDLYASPDGNIYQRKPDGWYRRQADGKWNFYAPTQGRIENGQLAGARSGQPAARPDQRAGAGDANRIVSAPNASGARAQALRERAPNAGSQSRAAEVADLERQYYTRALGQARAQNNRRNVSRPARGGGGRR